MIEELRIRGIGVFDEAVLPLHSGFTALTGETGAGKTMVLTGLGLVTGAKAEPSLVRHGRERAEADAIFTDPSEGFERWSDEYGAALDDGALTVSRVVPASGRARAFLGGRSVPAAVLAELAEEYVTVHGQSDQQRLRSPSAQRSALDDAAGHLALVDEYREAFDRLRGLENRRDQWANESAERLRERTALLQALHEIDELSPTDGEDDELRALTERLTNADELRATAQNVHSILDGGGEQEGIIGQLGSVERDLALAGRHDALFTQWSERMASVSSELSQILAELAGYRETIDMDPGELDRVHERRAALASLTRRWGPELGDVLAWAETARHRLNEIDAEPGSLDEMDAAVADARTRAEHLADQLHASRVVSASRIAEVVNDELRRLAMKESRFGIEVTGGDLGPHGRDQVVFTLSSVPHVTQLPVAQAASGGELSRIMLALELALASEGEHTFVFDEVDAGIGGATASEVAHRLSQLAHHHQVIVVTHLPQVAAAADRQIAVVKGVGTSPATTRVLDDKERVAEIARMLAGDDSPTARRHAEELIQRYRVAR